MLLPFFGMSQMDDDSTETVLLDRLQSNPYDYTAQKSLGELYLNSGSYQKADSLLELALVNMENVADSSEIIRVVELLGIVNRVDGDQNKSLKNLLQVVSFHARRNDTIDLFKAYINLAEFHRNIAQYNNAMHFLERANALAQVYNIPEEVYISYYHRSSAVLTETAIDIDLALAYSDSSMNIARRIGDYSSLATSANEKGFILYNLGDVNCERYFLMADSIWDALNNPRYRASVQSNLSRFYIAIGEYDKALELIEYNYEASVENGWDVITAEMLRRKSVVYEKTGKLREAYHLLDTARLLQMDIRDREYSDYIAEMSVKYDAVENEKKLIEQESQIVQANSRLERERITRIQFLVIAAAMSAIALIFGFSYYRINRKNLELSEQQKINKDTNERLQESLDNNKILYQELSHRVKNNLSVLSGILYLQQRSAENEEVKLALTDAQGRVKSMSLLHQYLYNFDGTESADSNVFLRRMVDEILSSYQTKDMKVDVDIDLTGFDMSKTRAMPLALILNEFVTNSLKHSFHEFGENLIQIRYFSDAEGEWITYLDSGTELSPDFLDRKYESLGVKLINLMVKQVGGSIRYYSIGGLQGAKMKLGK